MMMTRSISALEGRGVGLGVKVGSGVKVAVMVAVDVEVLMTGVAVDVEVEVAAANNSMGCGADPVGEGTGGKELPQILGRLPQLERMKASKIRVRRFRENFSNQKIIPPSTRRSLRFFLCALGGLCGAKSR
jgi:hypothetical protein